MQRSANSGMCWRDMVRFGEIMAWRAASLFSFQALQSVGGSLEAFYYSNGEQDFYIIVNLPDNISSTAITLAGNVSGTFSIRSVALLTPEEMDEAVKMRVDFRPPGH